MRDRPERHMANDDHALYISVKAQAAIFRKYQAGQREHGGSLARKAVQNHILEEAVDQMVYVLTHLDHLEEVAVLARKIQDISSVGHATYGYATQILNILDIGNAEGVEEEERT